MSLNQDRELCLKTLGEAFGRYFNMNLELSGGKGKAAVTEMYSSFYGKWLISDISKVLPVTPLGLISEISQRFDGGESFGFPYVKPDSFYRFKSFEVNVKIFTAENHPVTEDLKIFLEVISEADRNVKGDMGQIILGKKQEKELKNSLNLYSPGYLEFLHCLGSELRLIENIPAVNNTYVFRAAADFEDFFGGENIFEKIFEGSLRVFCNGMNMFFPEESPFFTPEFTKKLMSKPMKTNDILGLISKDFILDEEEDEEDYCDEDYFGDYSIMDLWLKSLSYDDEDDYEEDDENREMRMTSIYVLSISLSKWFYTVFGLYLNIIRPYGTMDADTYTLMQFYGANKKDIDYYQREGFFALMPEGYNLISFGLKLFPGAKNPFSVENELLSKMSIRDFIEDVPVFYGKKDIVSEDGAESKTNTFILKICNESVKNRAVKYLEFTEYNLLFDVCVGIVHSFNLGFFNDFSIFTDESRSPFSEYTSIKAGGRPHKKAEITFLNEILSSKGDKLWIELRKFVGGKIRTKAYRFSAEVCGTDKKGKWRKYPAERRKYND